MSGCPKPKETGQLDRYGYSLREQPELLLPEDNRQIIKKPE
jgi:hypothetical protein